MHLDYAILQKGPFKPKYDNVMHYLLDGHLVQYYIRWDDYIPSTISRRMEEFDDRIFIHTTTLVSESRRNARVYKDAYHILTINTPTPKTSYYSSITSHINPSTTHTTLRMIHRTPKQCNIDPLSYRVK